MGVFVDACRRSEKRNVTDQKKGELFDPGWGHVQHVSTKDQPSKDDDEHHKSATACEDARFAQKSQNAMDCRANDWILFQSPDLMARAIERTDPSTCQGPFVFSEISQRYGSCRPNRSSPGCLPRTCRKPTPSPLGMVPCQQFC